MTKRRQGYHPAQDNDQDLKSFRWEMRRHQLDSLMKHMWGFCTSLGKICKFFIIIHSHSDTK